VDTRVKYVTHFRLDKVDDVGGFSPTNVQKGNYFWLLVRASVTSDEPEFFKYVEQVSNYFFNKVGVVQDSVYKFLVLLHKDLSTDLYINDFPIAIEILAKRDIKETELVSERDIADIRRLKFPDVKIVETDKVICCFKVGWRFGLFFDLDRQEKLDIDAMYLDLGRLYRELQFHYIYKVLESKPQFEEMMKDGWFPFVELLGGEYRILIDAYSDRFDFDNRIQKVLGGFDRLRIERMTSRWWRNKIYENKKGLLQAGVNAFLQNDSEGYITCIKTLLSEAEGIIRVKYFTDTAKGKDVSTQDLLEHLLEKARTKSVSDRSLMLPVPFFDYLRNVVFSGFNLETGQVSLSRHSTSHGVADASVYTRARALQAILVLDQIYFYIS